MVRYLFKCWIVVESQLQNRNTRVQFWGTCALLKYSTWVHVLGTFGPHSGQLSSEQLFTENSDVNECVYLMMGLCSSSVVVCYQVHCVLLHWGRHWSEHRKPGMTTTFILYHKQTTGHCVLHCCTDHHPHITSVFQHVFLASLSSPKLCRQVRLLKSQQPQMHHEGWEQQKHLTGDDCTNIAACLIVRLSAVILNIWP